MNKTMQKVLSIVVATLMCITSLPLITWADEASQPREWYVSAHDGDDVNGTGTIDNPFKTIQKGAEMLGAGDTLYIREGIYDEKVDITASGIENAPISIKNYNNEEVVIRAAKVLENWTQAEPNIWVTDMPWNMEDSGQDNMLYKGGEQVLQGRHPNVPEGGSYLWPAQFTMDWADRHSSDIRELGTIHDDELTEPDGYWDGGKVFMQPGLNWTNVSANILSYTTGVLNIADHNIATNAYYDEREGNTYYIYDHYNTLDAEGEWYYNKEEQKVYYYSKLDPNAVEMSARSEEYVFNMTGQSYINFEGIDMLGAPPVVTNAHHINFDWCSLGSIDSPFDMNGDYITLKHSHIHDATLAAINVTGKRNAIFNCLIENTGWQGGGAGVTAIGCMEFYMGYNTVRSAGRSTLEPRGTNSVYEYNHFYDAGSVTADTGITYGGFFSGGTSEFRYNWLHDMTAQHTAFGFYLDNGNSYMTVHHNVVWDNDNTTGKLRNDGWVAMIVNMSSQGAQLYNNTFIGDAHQSGNMIYVEDDRLMNNIFTGEIQENVKMSVRKNNILGWLDPGFVDMENYDFTLRSDSIAIDNGIQIEGVTEGYIGDAPDIGAYEYGGDYWVPGHNWENPPVFEHKTPNYVQYSNRVAMSGFEASGDKMWEDYGWSKFGEGIVQSSYDNSITKIESIRRTGLMGIQLGMTHTLDYPGDELVDKATEIIETYNGLNRGIVNYPKSKRDKMYNKLPDVISDLVRVSSNLTSEGGFEDPDSRLGGESCAAKSVDEEAYSGSRSLKIYDMKYPWSGLRYTLYNTKDRKYRLSFKYKGAEGDTLQIIYTYTYGDWITTNDKRMGSTNFVSNSDEWQDVVFDINAVGECSASVIQFNSNRYGEGGYYYIDDFCIIDMTEAYQMREACAEYPEAKAILDEAIANKALTLDELADAMKKAAQIMLAEDKVAAADILAPMLKIVRDNRVSMDVGVRYTLSDIKPGRTYKLMCNAWVVNPEDKVVFTVKHNDNVIAEYETNASTWENKYVLFKSPENGDPVVIEVYKPMGKAAAYIDDISVLEHDPLVPTYKTRSGAKYVENNDFENGELWPWYSYDGKLELIPSDKGTSLKVTDGRAMQEIRTLPARKSYVISGDFKLAMPGVTSRDVELIVHSIENTSNGQRTAHNIGRATITNDKWTHIEGIIEIPAELSYNSMGYTAGLVGGNGSFLVENANVEELPMPTTPGTGDGKGLTFADLLKDKNWVSSSNGQGVEQSVNSISTTNGAIGYTGETFRDFRLTFNMKIDGYTAETYPSLTVRNANGGLSYSSGYTFIIRDSNIELQKYGTGIASPWLFVGDPNNPTGIYGAAKQTTAFKMGEWNTVTVGTTTEEKGVRIYLEVNGEVIYDYLDNVSTLDNAGCIVFQLNGTTKIEVKP